MCKQIQRSINDEIAEPGKETIRTENIMKRQEREERAKVARGRGDNETRAESSVRHEKENKREIK
jgi:hypothetical protein